ncbi:MAG TPA: gamma-glutamyltransferase, partial [Pseudonocardia sp.]|nr:gamma-glutamyltransferase [Pseudonocardia sp.]
MAPRTCELRGPRGAVSSTHYLGTSTAMAVLARGGNAFDAAVAAGFVLQVVEPHLCGPGGEVPAVFVTADDPAPCVLCGQG